MSDHDGKPSVITNDPMHLNPRIYHTAHEFNCPRQT